MAWQCQSEGAGRRSRRSGAARAPILRMHAALLRAEMAQLLLPPVQRSWTASVHPCVLPVKLHRNSRGCRIHSKWNITVILLFFSRKKSYVGNTSSGHRKKKVKTSWAPNFFYWTGGLVVRSPLGWAGLGYASHFDGTEHNRFHISLLDRPNEYWSGPIFQRIWLKKIRGLMCVKSISCFVP
jgi:hypothetical protein